jgi:adenylyltransferase/sulfurtransferase
LVLGAGALGNELIKNLCMLGVGKVTIVDLDVVENSNLSRSPLFRSRHEGLPKVAAASEGARELYPDVVVATKQVDIVTELGWGHYLDADLVLTGLDGREARLSAMRACIRTGKHLFDGAIEGIDGVARVFSGTSGPCYECTMGEQDWNLVRQRRSCNLLSRDQMRHGHTPTVSTISSIVAGLQVQQAIKHLHGLDVQPGSGLQVNGLGFDAWHVQYTVNPECYAHDEEGHPVRMPWSARTMSAESVIAAAAERLGQEPILELRHDIMTHRECPKCGATDEPLAPLSRLGSGAGLCMRCGVQVRWQSVARVEPRSPLARRSLLELGVPPYDIVRLRAGAKTFDAVLDADRPDELQ